MFGFALDAGVHDQRVQADEAPAGFVEAPAVLADDGGEVLPLCLRRQLLWRRPDRDRVVADIVIAGQVAAGDGKGVVQRLREDEIVAAGRGVEGEIAAVDDEVRPRRVDVFADAMKIIGQLLQSAGEVGVGNLGDAKLAHAIFLLLQCYQDLKSER